MLNIGDVINLEMKDATADKFKCKVVEIKDNQFYIDYPVNEATGKTAFLMNDTELLASFVNKEQNIYRFDTVVAGRLKEKIPMIILSYPGDDKLVKIQRREFVRIDTNVDIAIHGIHNEFAPFTTETVDISAGGTAIKLREGHKLEEGKEIIMWLSLPFQNAPIEYIKTKAEITNFIPVEKKGYIKAPAKFIDLDEKSKQLLIKYCFEQQILIRRKMAQY
ncbi:flagellar brake protein [Metabacillus fastidiosus]|uniref:flagellar brake protein n=1 Tax=Metabacillus fastidiosus TaxID=1458 RepID=UPI003D2BE53B